MLQIKSLEHSIKYLTIFLTSLSPSLVYSYYFLFCVSGIQVLERMIICSCCIFLENQCFLPVKYISRSLHASMNKYEPHPSLLDGSKGVRVSIIPRGYRVTAR